MPTAAAIAKAKYRAKQETKKKMLEYNKRYLAEHPGTRLKQMQRYRDGNGDEAKRNERREKKREQDAAYRKANRERERERHALYAKLYPEKRRETARKFRENNPEQAKILARKKTAQRRARLRSAPKNNLSRKDIERLVYHSAHCHWCKRPWTKVGKPTLDHVIALSNGGSNAIENIVCACKPCNSRKQARQFHPITGQGILI